VRPEAAAAPAEALACLLILRKPRTKALFGANDISYQAHTQIISQSSLQCYHEGIAVLSGLQGGAVEIADPRNLFFVNKGELHVSSCRLVDDEYTPCS
jgi:hypothetical protein